MHPVFREGLREVLGQAFARCAVKGCAKHSLGFVCSSCGGAACNSHLYLTPAMPPQPVCTQCIVEDFQGVADEAPKVVEATIVEDEPKAKRRKR